MTQETKDKIIAYPNFELGRDSILKYLRDIKVVGLKTAAEWAKYTKAPSFVSVIAPYITATWQEKGILDVLSKLDDSIKQEIFENTVPVLKMGDIVSYYKRAEENIVAKTNRKYIYQVQTLSASTFEDPDNKYIILSSLDSDNDTTIITTQAEAEEKTGIASHPYKLMPYKLN